MATMRWNATGVLICVALCILAAYWWRPQHFRQLKTRIVGMPVYEKQRRALSACVAATAGGKLWDTLRERVKDCVTRFSHITEDKFEVFHMGRFSEVKMFLPLVSTPEPCYQLTIGIGGDTKVEKEFLAKYPMCQVHGIEASDDQIADFAAVGKVIPHAVGVTAGRLPMGIRQPDGSYKMIEVDLRPLPDLLNNYIGSLLIHYVTLDIEGYDYNVLDALRYGQPFDRAGVAFCQIDAQLHGRKENEYRDADFDFEVWLPRLLLQSPYVPVFASVYGPHRKLTLINVDRAECQLAFAYSRYFEN